MAESADKTETGGNNAAKGKKSAIARYSMIYLVFMVIYFGLYDIMDSYNTSFYPMIVSFVRADFGCDLSVYYAVLGFASLGLYAVIIVQFLMDIVGRKPIMIAVFFGMGLTAYLLSLAANITEYGIALFFMFIFFSSDVWVVIIAEEAPEDRRAVYSYIIWLIGSIGVIVIPFFRNILIDASDPSTWRRMTYFAWLAMPLSLLGLFMKETEAFREEKRREKDKGIKRTLLGDIARFAEPFTGEYRPRIIAFILISILLGMNYASFQTIEDFFSLYYTKEVVSNLILVGVIGSFIVFIITGPLADKIGRRPVFTFYPGLLMLGVLGLIIFVPAVNLPGSYVSAILGQIGFWGSYTLSKVYCTENFPTEIRGTSTGLRSFSFALGFTVGSFISSLLLKIVSIAFIYALYAVTAFITIPLFVWKILPETKNKKIVET